MDPESMFRGAGKKAILEHFLKNLEIFVDPEYVVLELLSDPGSIEGNWLWSEKRFLSTPEQMFRGAGKKAILAHLLSLT